MSKISFLNFTRKIQSKFNFKINIRNPYKLCDIKPMYGYLFEDEIINYDYWGHADIDLIFGDLKKFISSIDHFKVNKLFRNGHFSIYKNSKDVNRYFKHKIHKVDFKFILSNKNNYSFDELPAYSINSIFDYLNEPIYHDNNLIADINPLYNTFKLYNLNPEKLKYITINIDYLFNINNNKIFGFYLKNNKILKKEFLYLHLQKRSFSNFSKNEKSFCIVPDKFVDNFKINVKILEQFRSNEIKLKPFYKSKISSLNYYLNKYYY